jgi:CRP/FNR family transcriptional regulator, cyclic AMP receptor protein
VTEHIPRIEQIRLRIVQLLQKDQLNSRIAVKAKNEHIYTCGDCDEKIYLVESGQVKTLVISPGGKECLIAIYAAGDLFGEVSLCGQTRRLETAVAMRNSRIRQISSRVFLDVLRNDSFLEALAQYLTFRLAEQQQAIGNLMLISSEQRLASTLLSLGEKLGRKDTQSLCIEQRISHHDLAEMVGTTRPRVTVFLKKFKGLGLIDLTPERHLIVKASRLHSYLERAAMGAA